MFQTVTNYVLAIILLHGFSSFPASSKLLEEPTKNQRFNLLAQTETQNTLDCISYWGISSLAWVIGVGHYPESGKRLGERFNGWWDSYRSFGSGSRYSSNDDLGRWGTVETPRVLQPRLCGVTCGELCT